MKRIIVVGINGSGKSEFSRRLGNKINIPVFHLDNLFLKPNWETQSREDWDGIVSDLINKEKWIIDGTYKRTLEVRVKKADTIIYLEMSKTKAFYRVFKRRIQYRKKSRSDLPNYLNEQVSFGLLKKVFLFSRKDIFNTLNRFDDKKIIILNNQDEIDIFLKGL